VIASKETLKEAEMKRREARASRADHFDNAPSESAIAERAYEIYVRRGRDDGRALEDWLQAEEELRQGR
jgi:hypothetical protein